MDKYFVGILNSLIALPRKTNKIKCPTKLDYFTVWYSLVDPTSTFLLVEHLYKGLIDVAGHVGGVPTHIHDPALILDDPYQVCRMTTQVVLRGKYMYVVSEISNNF